MTTTEAMKLFRSATVADLCSIDPDILTFGAITRSELVDALNDVTSVVDEGTYFTVRAPAMELMVTVDERGIHIHGARRTK